MDQGKLRSLMFHAGFCNEDGGWDSRPICEQEHDNFQRFAELIIRECANVAADHDALDIYEEIREHFGVEK